MLTAHQISKSFGPETLLDRVTFSLKAGEKAGLIGPNGCGKTTLLRILASVDQPDSGSVQLTPPSLRLGYLPQSLDFEPGETLADFLERGRPTAALTLRLEQLATALARKPGRLDLQAEYDTTLARLAATAEDGRAPATLEALGLGDVPAETPVVSLSGGQKTRLALAAVLLSGPQALLLDEPTNHLDTAMLEWLEGWLAMFGGAALIVSHDRTFLDRLVTRILDLNPKTHAVREYTGNYSDYIRQTTLERDRQWSEWHDQETEIRRMRQDIHRTKEQALGVERTTTPRQPGVRRIAKKVANKARSREKKLARYLKADERVEKPKAGWQMKLEFGDASLGGQDVLRLEDLAVGYGDHVLLRGLDRQVRQGTRIALTGPNGAGKTTLLRTIAGLLPPLRGRVHLGANVRVGYMAQEQEALNPSHDALSTLRAVAPLSETDARAFLHFFLFTGDDVFTPVGSLSFGERARLNLAVLVARGSNLLLLDEPINHLDIPSRARFEQALRAFGGTMLVVVHDRYFVKQFATEVWRVEADGLKYDLGHQEPGHTHL